MASYKTCFSVSPECPVEATTYGYYPVLWANVILCVLFGVCGLAQIGLGIYYKTWTWAITVSIGCMGEFAGYIGRIFMHYNPWNNAAYEDQIIAIILAPSFIAAGINLTLKYIVLSFEPSLSRIRPAGYTWIFVTIDFSCIAVQAIGGGMAASADNTSDLTILNAGNHVIVVGIVLQVVNLVIFGAVAGEYAWRLRRHRHELGSKLDLSRDRKFKAFLVAVTIAYWGILIRCIYRIPEMALGWGSKNQRNETEFMVLDGLMVVIAAISITAVHPGWSFPALASTIKMRSRRRKTEQDEAIAEASPDNR